MIKLSDLLSEGLDPVGKEDSDINNDDTDADGFSDYQEVDGLYFPFAISMQGQGITIKEILVNPEVDMAMFAFPETPAPVEVEKN